jgi:hypothetical protein
VLRNSADGADASVQAAAQFDGVGFAVVALLLLNLLRTDRAIQGLTNSPVNHVGTAARAAIVNGWLR